MNMFSNLMGNFIDTEKITHDTIQSTLQDVAEELNCSYKDFFIMIKPIDETFTMKFYIYKLENGAPKPIRELPLKEIFTDE